VFLILFAEAMRTLGIRTATKHVANGNEMLRGDWLTEREALTVNGLLLFSLPSHRKETRLADTPLSLYRSGQEFDEQQVFLRCYFNVIPKQGFSLVNFSSFGPSSQEPAAD
jgi:hypothetical protein